MSEATPKATCFISYNHADKALATSLASDLSEAGYRVWIDQGELRVGDSLVSRIADAIGAVDFLIALVSEGSIGSNWCQKEISLAMTGEIAQQGITVLPCRVGDVDMPATLTDKLYLTIDAEKPAEAARALDADMQKYLAPADPLPRRKRGPKPAPTTSATAAYTPTTEVRLLGVDTNSMTSPRNDGTAGSALYMVPINLSVSPDALWRQLFVRHWDQPTRFTSMHRRGIASVSGSRIHLNGTTVEEVERYHVETLKLAVQAANRDRREMAESERRASEQRAAEQAEHKRAADEAAQRIKFD